MNVSALRDLTDDSGGRTEIIRDPQDLDPATAGVADELCFIKSMHTEAINHDPAITFLQTGFQIAGRPSIGAWWS